MDERPQGTQAARQPPLHTPAPISPAGCSTAAMTALEARGAAWGRVVLPGDVLRAWLGLGSGLGVRVGVRVGGRARVRAWAGFRVRVRVRVWRAP